jgi:mRNA interferase MazF
MKEGNIVLVDLPQSGGGSKLRPALILRQLPKYNDFLVCGISTQINQYIKDLDEILNEDDIDFDQTGLNKTSLIRIFSSSC